MLRKITTLSAAIILAATLTAPAQAKGIDWRRFHLRDDHITRCADTAGRWRTLPLIRNDDVPKGSKIVEAGWPDSGELRYFVTDRYNRVEYRDPAALGTTPKYYEVYWPNGTVHAAYWDVTFVDCPVTP